MTKSTISSQCSKLLKSDEQKIRLDITWSERINAGTTRVIGKYRKWLEENGFGKLADRLDAQEAAAAGLHSTPLTSANIAKHLEQVGLSQEFTLHHRMRGLSGGQKVKVVLGAACWQHPHLIVLS